MAKEMPNFECVLYKVITVSYQGTIFLTHGTVQTFWMEKKIKILSIIFFSLYIYFFKVWNSNYMVQTRTNINGF